MIIRKAKIEDQSELIELICQFRMSLAGLRGKITSAQPQAAEAELIEYQEKNFPIYVAETDSSALGGYLVCRVDGDVVWAESLYVKPDLRRSGVASALFSQAEELAKQLGGGTPYNWVDPNNKAMLRFLAKHGYNVLNLIEIRKESPRETLTQTTQVGDFTFKSY